eukprot:GHVR01169004.1.p2 GENE.GHVR01169004.1~~GHVR01169004.1.p2  ORF type:complete len:157 (+),score=28.66 GHVR01169004.1:1476-1946(+)
MMQIATFDTYKIIKRLEGKGASTDLAQEIVQAIQEGRTLELSALVSKNDFYDFKDEFHEFKESIYNFRDETKERFSKLESEIALVRRELGVIEDRFDNKINSVESRLTNKIDLTASQLETKIQESQNINIKWMIGLIIPLYITTLGIIIKLFITGN